MRIFTRKILAILMLLVMHQATFSQNWQLVWQDEFNYTGLPDPNKWGYDVGAGGWGNGEAQYYNNARSENSRVENGNLILEARRDWAGAEYSSARLVSRGKGDWTYGRIEIRAKIPVGQGLWPAIWMLPTDWAYGGWPASGEIDIMESFALGGLKYDKVEANIHTQAYNHTIGTNKGAPITGLSNIEQNYHVYRVTWTANKMVFDVDGREYFTFNNEGTWQKWPYDKRFHLIMNIAVGGSLGTWIDPNIFPKRMEVDYVRVYQDNGVPPINPTTDVVTAYKDCNYAGFSAGLPIGDYNLSQLKAKGISDNDISSFRVAEGYKVILFDNDNFGGASTTITSDMGCSADWNDRVGSLRVRANGDAGLQGSYYLQNRNSNLFMDVVGGLNGTQDGVNIQQWNTAATANQFFNFIHLGDGMYEIVASHSGKCLDVSAISTANGANVQQWTYYGTGNQKFIAVPTGDGFYKLIASHSGKMVEVAGASTALEGNVQQWENKNQVTGMWKLVKPSTDLVTAYYDCNYTGWSAGLNLGNYTKYQLGVLGMREKALSSIRIPEGYKVILYDGDNFTGASTTLTSSMGCSADWNDRAVSLRILTNGVTNVAGTYFLQNRNSGLNMDIWGAGTGDGANVAQANPHTGTNQQFKLTHLGDGTYQVLAVHSNKSIDIDAIKTNDGANVQQWTYFGSFNQQFIVVPTDLAGTYKLIAKHSGKVVEVAGASTASGANVQQWTNNNQTCGQWKFVPVVVTPPQPGNGDGLTGNYFNGMNMETPVYSRKDATINFNWGNGSPNSAVNTERFSAVWTGQIQPMYSDEYTFYINSDNGRRLWINGQLVIDKWIDDWNIDYSGKITLTANQKYNIKIEYFENVGGAGIKFEWESASQKREVVPTSQLYSNALPTVSLTSPSADASFMAPASVTLSATASDNGGSIAKVEFYNGTQKLGEDASSPYSYTWTNVAAGTYAVTARAIDNLGGVAVSSSVNVTVDVNPNNQPPVVSLTAPSNNASFNAPASITISANASDADGSVSKVEFYNGTQKLGEDASAPYSYTWTNVPAGSYTFSAKAYDNKNAVTASGSVTVTVKTVVTNACSGLATYAENGGYVAGSKVKNAGRQFECKEWPYSGWCNGAAWAYGPGTGAYWSDAWYDKGSCGARTGEDNAAQATDAVSIAPNPATDLITIQSNTATTVTIFSSQGMEVLAASKVAAQGSLDISSLPAGMYLVKIDSGSEVLTRMIVKQ